MIESSTGSIFQISFMATKTSSIAPFSFTSINRFVRCGKAIAWQKHVPKTDRAYIEQPTLYNLKEDIGETTNVAKDHPEIVERLTKQLEFAKQDIGYHHVVGENSRRKQ